MSDYLDQLDKQGRAYTESYIQIHHGIPKTYGTYGITTSAVTTAASNPLYNTYTYPPYVAQNENALFYELYDLLNKEFMPTHIEIYGSWTMNEEIRNVYSVYDNEYLLLDVAFYKHSAANVESYFITMTTEHKNLVLHFFEKTQQVVADAAAGKLNDFKKIAIMMPLVAAEKRLQFQRPVPENIARQPDMFGILRESGSKKYGTFV